MIGGVDSFSVLLRAVRVQIAFRRPASCGAPRANKAAAESRRMTRPSHTAFQRRTTSPFMTTNAFATTTKVCMELHHQPGAAPPAYWVGAARNAQWMRRPKSSTRRLRPRQLPLRWQQRRRRRTLGTHTAHESLMLPIMPTWNGLGAISRCGSKASLGVAVEFAATQLMLQRGNKVDPQREPAAKSPLSGKNSAWWTSG